MRLSPNALRALTLAAALVTSAPAARAEAVTPQITTLHDAARDRDVPVALYVKPGAKPRRLVLLSHGFGVPHTAYGFIGEALAARGYAVAAIQHDLPGDPPLPNTGDIMKDRTPAWRRGGETMRFVIRTLTEKGVARPGARTALIGHSMGGDAVMLLAAEEPALFSAAISLDNRRVALPRVRRPKICSARSADLPADPGVLPSAEESHALRMRIVTIEGLKHDAMTDEASPAQKQAMLELILKCLR